VSGSRPRRVRRILRAVDSETPGREARASGMRASPKDESTLGDTEARPASRRIHRILEGLSATERLALVLRYMATLELNEVAAILAVPVRTVKRWVNQAPVPRDETLRRPRDSAARRLRSRRRPRRPS
jgi:RNA polymerase sigma factor (sigma-70 family)